MQTFSDVWWYEWNGMQPMRSVLFQGPRDGTCGRAEKASTCRVGTHQWACFQSGLVFTKISNPEGASKACRRTRSISLPMECNSKLCRLPWYSTLCTVNKINVNAPGSNALRMDLMLSFCTLWIVEASLQKYIFNQNLNLCIPFVCKCTSCQINVVNCRVKIPAFHSW